MEGIFGFAVPLIRPFRATFSPGGEKGRCGGVVPGPKKKWFGGKPADWFLARRLAWDQKPCRYGAIPPCGKDG